MSAIDQYLTTHAERSEEELCEFLRIPSISADPNRAADMVRAADWLTDQFRRLRFVAELIPTAGPPLVYAESPNVPGAPTALVYGHYDVQPPDPLGAWVTPPFEPTRRDGNLYARGATDDKGQLFTHVKGAEAWITVEGRLPINLKFLIEGEEEVSSGGLERFLVEHADRLACQCVVISDSSQFAPGVPAITYGLRGIAYYELHVTGPRQDLHSGVFGGAVMNPANALTQILSGLIDRQGRVTIPEFYDDVLELSAKERDGLTSLPFDEKQFFDQIGVPCGAGEAGFTAIERRWVRPTFDINGLWGGYQGEGSKTVLPAMAGAKFSFRLVPHQDPVKIKAGLERRIAELCPPSVRWRLIYHHGAPAVLTSPDSPQIEAASRAIDYAFGRRPVLIRDGGSIPIVTEFQQRLGAPALLLGWGQEDDGAHGPNEKFCLADFHRGIQASARLWEELRK
ncbi:MAG: dipeptidase [Thermoguttaceae bacterium]